MQKNKIFKMLKWMNQIRENTTKWSEKYEMNIYLVTHAHRLKFWEELVKPTFLAMLQIAL
jgi:RAB protein geranylgeranyltransferase component A